MRAAVGDDGEKLPCRYRTGLRVLAAARQNVALVADIGGKAVPFDQDFAVEHRQHIAAERLGNGCRPDRRRVDRRRANTHLILRKGGCRAAESRSQNNQQIRKAARCNATEHPTSLFTRHRAQAALAAFFVFRDAITPALLTPR